jgi:hypothetical protein
MNTEELYKKIKEIEVEQITALNEFNNARGRNIDHLTQLIETFPLVEISAEEEDDLSDELNDLLCEVSESFEANIYVNFNRARQSVNVDVDFWQSSHC